MLLEKEWFFFVQTAKEKKDSLFFILLANKLDFKSEFEVKRIEDSMKTN